MSSNYFSEDDLKELGESWGANVIRWQMTLNEDEYGYFTDLPKYKTWISKKLEELDLALASCRKHGLLAVVDLHSPPGGGSTDGKLFYEKVYNDYFITLWGQIAERYAGNKTIWAYDLVNEPLQAYPSPKGLDLVSTLLSAAKAIRKYDPDTAILVESDGGDSISGFSVMSPLDITNVVYEVHMYAPATFTMQNAEAPSPTVKYPGTIDGLFYDRETLRRILKPVRDFQQKYNVHIYVGEFSAIRWAPGAARYLDDCIGIFEEYGWDWTYHAYREWPGWSVEYENIVEDKPAITDTDRKMVLLKWFSKNEKPSLK
jgi:hypothetical protein